MGLNKSVIGLSKSVMHIIIRFVTKFCVIRWFRNFKILLHSRDTAYDSFIENILYDSHLTHMICNIHIIWLQISILIQWNQNFWDTPTQIFKIQFSRKCVGGKFFWLQIRIQRKISRRLVCVHMGSIVFWTMICAKIAIAWVLNAI